MLKSEVKVCSGNYSNGNKEFSGTYLDEFKNGEHHEWRVGVWKFWYPDGKIMFEGIYKEGTLISKKCWTSKSETINCNLLKMTKSEEERMFKENT